MPHVTCAAIGLQTISLYRDGHSRRTQWHCTCDWCLYTYPYLHLSILLRFLTPSSTVCYWTFSVTVLVSHMSYSFNPPSHSASYLKYHRLSDLRIAFHRVLWLGWKSLLHTQRTLWRKQMLLRSTTIFNADDTQLHSHMSIVHTHDGRLNVEVCVVC